MLRRAWALLGALAGTAPCPSATLGVPAVRKSRDLGRHSSGGACSEGRWMNLPSGGHSGSLEGNYSPSRAGSWNEMIPRSLPTQSRL